MIEDLWGELDFLEEEENRTIDIIREQAVLIGKKTDGQVKGSFTKIEYKTIAKNPSMVSTLSALATVAGNATPKVVEVDELSDREDINGLYKKTPYKFELYNDVYKFRVFTLEYSEAFPIEIIIDEGICEELKIYGEKIINSNHEMEDVLRLVFSSYKVKLIISRMKSKISSVNKEKILDYVREHPVFTVTELADEMGWSKANTQKRLKELECEGLICREDKDGRKLWEVML